MKMKSWMIILAALLLAVLPAFACAEADDETVVTIVDNFIRLPETENIAEGKPVQASAHNDVYVSSNLNDGKTTTYWESKGFPAEMTVDLQGTFTVSTAAFLLNPASIWEPRTQEIAVLVSTDGENFTEVSPAAAYTFDAETGNRVRIDFGAVQASHVRVIITSNTAAPAHAKGAQVAEICIYGE